MAKCTLKQKNIVNYLQILAYVYTFASAKRKKDEYETNKPIFILPYARGFNV